MRTIKCIKFDASYLNERGDEMIHIVNVPDFAKVRIRSEEEGSEKEFTLGELVRLASRSPRMRMGG